ncbi:MAG: hypothetical protein HC945_04005 [Nitrosarchaeum sp.]|nr:hypothetical protein [Nitrosarchaeum sp.]
MNNDRIKNYLLDTDIVGERFGDLVVTRRYRDNSEIIMDRFINWLSYWGGLIDNIIGILTYGYIHTGFVFDVLMFKARMQYRKETGKKDW